ncbi:MAG: hypothetical protein JOZ25_02145 [Actinobacteria bacterium]|nr:hypothetical protein [Actinomycetota bacterium]
MFDAIVARLAAIRRAPGMALDWTLVAVGCGLLAARKPAFFADGIPRYDAVQALVQHHHVTSMKYPLIGPLFSAPLWLFGNAVGHAPGATARFNLLVFLVGLVLIWRLLRTRVDRALLTHFILLMVGASMFAAHVVTFYGETFTAVLVGAGLMAAAAGVARAGWTAAAIGAANTPVSILGLAFAAAVQALRRKRLRYGLAVAAALALTVLDSELRLHTAFTHAYLHDRGFRTVMPFSGRPGFSYPIFFGLLSVFFSFGKGIVFFAPGLFLPARARLRLAGERLWHGYRLWLAFIAGLVLVYAPWWAWYGGSFWGPRFFLFASMPACLALAARVRYPGSLAARVVTAVALILSIWVGISAYVFDQAAAPVCVANDFALEHLCWYTPEFSVLWRPFVQAMSLSALDVLYLTFAAIVAVRMLHALFRGVRDDADVIRLRALVPDYRTGWRL